MNIVVKTDTMTSPLQDLIRKVSDPDPALREIGDDIAQNAIDAFTNPSLRPEPWAPLKPSTIARKKKDKHGSEPLVAFGFLARSPRVVRTVSYSANSKGVVVGSDRKAGNYSLAAIHQLGAPKANIPARPFFPFDAAGNATPSAIARVKAILLRWLNK